MYTAGWEVVVGGMVFEFVMQANCVVSGASSTGVGVAVGAVLCSINISSTADAKTRSREFGRGSSAGSSVEVEGVGSPGDSSEVEVMDVSVGGAIDHTLAGGDGESAAWGASEIETMEAEYGELGGVKWPEALVGVKLALMVVLGRDVEGMEATDMFSAIVLSQVIIDSCCGPEGED